MTDVAAVVINRNTREMLRACLESILKSEFESNIEVWVVDSGSSDGSQAMVLGEFPGANLVYNGENTGYAKACNQGLRVTSAPYVIVMNSDTVLSADTISVVAGFLDGHPDCAAAGPRILNPDGTLQLSCREFPSMWDAFAHAFLGLFRPDNRYSARYKKSAWDHETASEVDWVSGAFMALRRDAVDAVGGFDEGYFMYVEDVDICWRLRQAGGTVDYIGRGDVVHFVAQSSRMASTRMMLHHHVSMLRFHRRTYRGPCRHAVNMAVSIGVAARFGLIVVLNTFYRARAALGGKLKVIMPGRQ
jgi:N-acetylglucosaminyl-diphospho-decaprenol L-rhamnosyltransferase